MNDYNLPPTEPPSQGWPQGAPPQAPAQSWPQGGPPHAPAQGWPQGVPPQAPAQGVPPQAPAQGWPQGVPPQAPAQGWPQGVPPQAPVQGWSQGAPPQAPAQGWSQGVPPQAPAQGWSQGVPPQAPAQDWPQGAPPQAPAQGSPAPWQNAPSYAPPFSLQQEDPRRRGASHTLNHMCLLSLAQTGLSFVWQVPLMLLLSVLGVDILTNAMGYQWLSAVLVPLATALPFAAYLLFRKEDPAHYLKFERVGFTGGLLCVLAGLAISLLGNYPALFVQEFFGLFGYSSSGGYTAQGEAWPSILLEIAVVAVLVPFMEEFAFRGVILSSLRRYGLGFSVVASALVFGMAHLDFSTVVFATISGLALGFLYAKTNNLWLVVLIHGLNNLIAVLGSHADFLFGDMSILISNLIVFVPILLGLLSLLLLLIFKRGMFISAGSPRYDGPAYPLKAGESASAIVRAPAFWVAAGLMALYTLSLFFVA